MDKKICFVVTPIGNSNDPIRRHIDGIIDQSIVPALGKEFDVTVAHREYKIGSINDRVIQSVYNSDLVIANLTGLNPNVMFELAIRYSFGKPAVVIAEEGTKLPFDITDENTIFYINDPAGAAELKDRIEKFVNEINWEKNDYGPVFSSIKKAAVVDGIETTLVGEDQKAFSFLVDKIGNIEEELRILRSDNNFYSSKYIDQKISDISANAYAAFDLLIKNPSSENIYNILKQYYTRISNIYGIEYGELFLEELKELAKSDKNLSQTTISRIMNGIGKI